jgi:hypothetical protein
LESKLDTSDVLCKIDKFTMHINICWVGHHQLVR